MLLEATYKKLLSTSKVNYKFVRKNCDQTWTCLDKQLINGL